MYLPKLSKKSRKTQRNRSARYRAAFKRKQVKRLARMAK